MTGSATPHTTPGVAPAGGQPSRRWHKLQRARKAPEHSGRLRAITFAAQAVSVVALAYHAQVWLAALLALIILALGHRYTYRHCAAPSRRVRLLVFVGLHLAFVWLFCGLFIGQPYPQAQLAMLAMAIIAWDLITRLNLYSGFGFALGNLYIAATLSRDLLFGLFLLLFVGLLLAFLWVADSEDGVKDNPLIVRPVVRSPAGDGTPHMPASWSQPLAWGLRLGLGLLLLVPLIFIFSPRYAAIPPLAPFSLRVPVRGGPTSQIVNPALPLVQIEGWSNDRSDYYYGFDNQLDLSYRGGLSDTIMMFVRSPAASYWRSHAYDLYDGRTWRQSDPTLTPIVPAGQWDYELREWPEGDKFAQTFYIVQSMPNLLFTGGDPVVVVIAADSVSRDGTGGLRLGGPLAAGITYSVLSTPQNFTAEALRPAGDSYPPEISAPYLQLPGSVTARTRQLATDLTRNAPTAYDKVVALRDHLLQNYPYDYFPPPQAPNSDAVDQFLFVDRRGVCEHYVSAHVVMLRSLGIPARLVSGFGSGDYNAVTGYFEVRANHAHAWTEVYFPGFGWVPFDPTPGWDGFPQTGPINRWIFGGLADNWGGSAISLGPALAAGVSLVSVALRPGLGLLGVGLLLAGLWLAWRWGGRRWRWHRRQHPHSLRHDPARRRVFAAYRRAQRQLRLRRGPAQTVQEQAAVHTQLADLADLVDIAAYRPEPPDAAMVTQAEKWRGKRQR